MPPGSTFQIVYLSFASLCGVLVFGSALSRLLAPSVILHGSHSRSLLVALLVLVGAVQRVHPFGRRGFAGLVAIVFSIKVWSSRALAT